MTTWSNTGSLPTRCSPSPAAETGRTRLTTPARATRYRPSARVLPHMVVGVRVGTPNHRGTTPQELAVGEQGPPRRGRGQRSFTPSSAPARPRRRHHRPDHRQPSRPRPCTSPSVPLGCSAPTTCAHCRPRSVDITPSTVPPRHTSRPRSTGSPAMTIWSNTGSPPTQSSPPRAAEPDRTKLRGQCRSTQTTPPAGPETTRTPKARGTASRAPGSARPAPRRRCRGGGGRTPLRLPPPAPRSARFEPRARGSTMPIRTLSAAGVDRAAGTSKRLAAPPA